MYKKKIKQILLSIMCLYFSSFTMAEDVPNEVVTKNPHKKVTTVVAKKNREQAEMNISVNKINVEELPATMTAEGYEVILKDLNDGDNIIVKEKLNKKQLEDIKYKRKKAEKIEFSVQSIDEKNNKVIVKSKTPENHYLFVFTKGKLRKIYTNKRDAQPRNLTIKFKNLINEPSVQRLYDGLVHEPHKSGSSTDGKITVDGIKTYGVGNGLKSLYNKYNSQEKGNFQNSNVVKIPMYRFKEYDYDKVKVNFARYFKVKFGGAGVKGVTGDRASTANKGLKFLTNEAIGTEKLLPLAKSKEEISGFFKLFTSNKGDRIDLFTYVTIQNHFKIDAPKGSKRGAYYLNMDESDKMVYREIAFYDADGSENIKNKKELLDFAYKFIYLKTGITSVKYDYNSYPFDTPFSITKLGNNEINEDVYYWFNINNNDNNTDILNQYKGKYILLDSNSLKINGRDITIKRQDKSGNYVGIIDWYYKNTKDNIEGYIGTVILYFTVDINKDKHIEFKDVIDFETLPSEGKTVTDTIIFREMNSRLTRKLTLTANNFVLDKVGEITKSDKNKLKVDVTFSENNGQVFTKATETFEVNYEITADEIKGKDSGNYSGTGEIEYKLEYLKK